jgi:hypothetical protein
MPLTKDDYRKAIIAQDAVNASGLVHSLSEVMPRIREEPDCTGTDYVNHHPIVVLYINKLASLNCSCDTLTYSAAYALCRKRAEHSCNCGAGVMGRRVDHAPDCPLA